MIDPSGNISKTNKKIVKKIICPKCQGYGLVKQTPVLCDCSSTFCMKCENREGFIVKPWEECESCFGSGQIEEIKKI